MKTYEQLMEHISAHEYPIIIEIGKYIFETFRPKSIIDIGCGPGIYLLPAIDGRATVLGIDSCPTAGGVLPKECFLCTDIKVFRPDCKYDLALCIEVAEHLPETLAKRLVDLLCNCSDTLIFSAAHLGQTGDFHLNCQPIEYWLEMFEQNKYQLDIVGTRKLCDFLNHSFCDNMWWLRTNIRVIRNCSGGSPCL